MLTLPGTHQTCTWHSTGWQWPTPVSTPSSTTGWIKGILFILSLSIPSYTTGWKVSNCSYCWLVLVLLLFGVFSNLIRRCGLQSPFNHQFCLTCMSRTSFGKYIDSYHWVKKWKRQIAVWFINLIANKKEKLSCITVLLIRFRDYFNQALCCSSPLSSVGISELLGSTYIRRRSHFL